MSKPRFDLEIRQPDDRGRGQWIVEYSVAGRIEHGPFMSYAKAKEVIKRRKAELSKMELTR